MKEQPQKPEESPHFPDNLAIAINLAGKNRREWIQYARHLEHENTALKKRVAELEEERELEHERFLGYLGFMMPEESNFICDRCSGVGRRRYGSTSTWRGGIGGQTMTSDVCDECWGTGRNDRKGPNLRKVYARLQELEKENEYLTSDKYLEEIARAGW